MIKTQPNFINELDLSESVPQAVADIGRQIGFEPTQIIRRSDYYGTGRLRSVHYQGTYQEQPAVLKLSGEQSEVSEAEMISQFEQQNQSQLIRPPKLLKFLPWNEKQGYEALIIELVDGEKLVTSGTLQTQDQIEQFFQVYQEYKSTCIHQPWLELEDAPFAWEQSLADLVDISQKVKPESQLRQANDQQLAKKGLKLLSKIWSDVDWQFMHGHLSVEDMVKKDQDIILLSNNFWQWKQPFYDAVFGYHWFMYTLARVRDISAGQIEEQRELWLNQIHELAGDDHELVLIKAALLERAVAGLLVDSLAYLDEKAEMTAYLVATTRQQVKRLIGELESVV